MQRTSTKDTYLVQLQAWLTVVVSHGAALATFIWVNQRYIQTGNGAGARIVGQQERLHVDACLLFDYGRQHVPVDLHVE